MASHSHLHQAHFSSASCSCSCSCCKCCTQTHFTSSTQPPPVDPLVQAIASQILQSYTHRPVLETQSCHPVLETQNCHPVLDALHLQSQRQFQKRQFQEKRFCKRPVHQEEPVGVHYSTVASLAERIEALESFLLKFSDPSAPSFCRASHSLRDLAARTIQIHFRLFLVRRSRALGQLKELARIKSVFNSLRSSFSIEANEGFDIASERAVDLLVHVDSIQACDPMVRDGKRSIRRDLVKFLELIKSFSSKRNRHFAKATKISKCRQYVSKPRVSGTRSASSGGDQAEMIEKLRRRVENISARAKICEENHHEDVEPEELDHCSDDDEGTRIVIEDNQPIRNGVRLKRSAIQPRLRKNVTFADDDNEYHVFNRSNNPTSDGDSASLDESNSTEESGEPVENLCNRDEEIRGFVEDAGENEEAQMKGRGSPPFTDEEANRRRNLTNGNKRRVREQHPAHDGVLAFSAPLPVKMEPKADSMKARKTGKL